MCETRADKVGTAIVILGFLACILAYVWFQYSMWYTQTMCIGEGIPTVFCGPDQGTFVGVFLLIVLGVSGIGIGLWILKIHRTFPGAGIPSEKEEELLQAFRRTDDEKQVRHQVQVHPKCKFCGGSLSTEDAFCPICRRFQS